MHTYRSSTQIQADILDIAQYAGMEGIRTAPLLRKSNLSHTRLTKFLSDLTGTGLVNRIICDGHASFVITPRGSLYLAEYKKFAALAESFGLDM